MTIHIEPLSVSSWETCANLHVRVDQEDSIPNNLHTIASLNFFPQTKAVAIKNEEDTIVGFATYGLPDDGPNPKLFRFMIDESHQGKGYGKEALKTIMQEMFTMCELPRAKSTGRQELKVKQCELGYIFFSSLIFNVVDDRLFTSMW